MVVQKYFPSTATVRLSTKRNIALHVTSEKFTDPLRLSAESLLQVLGPSVFLRARTTNARIAQRIHTKSDREN